MEGAASSAPLPGLSPPLRRITDTDNRLFSRLGSPSPTFEPHISGRPNLPVPQVSFHVDRTFDFQPHSSVVAASPTTSCGSIFTSPSPDPPHLVSFTNPLEEGRAPTQSLPSIDSRMSTISTAIASFCPPPPSASPMASTQSPELSCCARAVAMQPGLLPSSR
jgi:hypothetical protein